MVLRYAAVDSSVFVLQGLIQNVPPLLAPNGRCACLCINQGAVNLPFNRRGSQAGNYFWICKRENKTETPSREADRDGHIKMDITDKGFCFLYSMFYCQFKNIGHGLKMPLLCINVTFFSKNLLFHLVSLYIRLNGICDSSYRCKVRTIYIPVDGWILPLCTTARSDSIYSVQLLLTAYLISCIPVSLANKDISFLFPVGLNLIHPCSLLKWFIAPRHTLHGTVCLYKVRGDSVFACVCLNFIGTLCRARIMQLSNNNLQWIQLEKAKCK